MDGIIFIVLFMAGLAWTVYSIFGSRYRFDQKLKKAVQECKEGKTTPFKRSDFFSRFKAKRKWEKDHPYQAFVKKAYRRVRAFIYNLPELPRDGYRKIKRGIQRAYYGWCHEDTWNLEHYLAKVMYGSVKHLFKYSKTTFRTRITKNPETDYDEDESKRIREEILYALKTRFDISEGDREGYYPTLTEKQRKKLKCLTKEENDRLNEGLKLFNKYFFSLWD